MEVSCGPDSADGRQLDCDGLDQNTGTSYLMSAISYSQNVLKLEDRQDKTYLSGYRRFLYSDISLLRSPSR